MQVNVNTKSSIKLTFAGQLFLMSICSSGTAFHKLKRFETLDFMGQMKSSLKRPNE